MEALAAIGLATNIITFIDFSYKLISGSHQILNSTSGLTPESSRLGTVVDDLRLITDKLVSDLPGNTQNEKEPSKRYGLLWLVPLFASLSSLLDRRCSMQCEHLCTLHSKV